MISRGGSWWRLRVNSCRHHGIAKQCATKEPELAESSGGAGPSWCKSSGMNSAAATAAVKSVGEPRPLGIAKFGAKKESELAVSRRTRLLEELREQWERQFGYRVKFSERFFVALNSLFACVWICR